MNEYNTCAGKKIGIYKELAVVIVTAFTIAVLTSLGAFIVCRHYGVLVDVTEDCSDYKRKYDIQVMGMVRELDSALSNAMDEISANELDDDKNLGDAMKYLLLNDRASVCNRRGQQYEYNHNEQKWSCVMEKKSR